MGTVMDMDMATCIKARKKIHTIIKPTRKKNSLTDVTLKIPLKTKSQSAILCVEAVFKI